MQKKADVVLYMMGSIAYAFSQWSILTVITKFFSLELAGHYIYVLAIFSPLAILFNFGLRNSLASDVQGKYPDIAYRRARAGGLLLFSGSCFIYLLAANEENWLVFLVFSIKATDSLSELIYGAWLREKTTRNYGISQTLRLALFAILFLVGWSLFPGSVGNLFSYPIAMLVVWVFFDRKLSPLVNRAKTSRMTEYSLVRESGRLGVSSFLVACGVSIPRLVIEHRLGSVALAQFALLIYFVSIAAMFVMAVCQVSTADFARLLISKSGGLRRAVLSQLVVPIGIYSTLFVLCLAFLGGWVMKHFYGIEGYRRIDFFLVGLGGAATFTYMALNAILSAAREFKKILALTISSVLLVFPVYWMCTALFGGPGSYIAYLSCALVSLVLMSFQILKLRHQRSPSVFV